MPKPSRGWRDRWPTSQTASGPLRFKTDWREEIAGLQVQPLGAARRAVPARDWPARRGRRPGRAGSAGRPGQADLCRSTRWRRSCRHCWPTTRQMLFQRALDFRAANTHDGRHATTSSRQSLDEEGGFLMAHWCGAAGCETAGQRRDRRDHPRHPVRLAGRTGQVRWSTASLPASGSSSREPTSEEAIGRTKKSGRVDQNPRRLGVLRRRLVQGRHQPQSDWRLRDGRGRRGHRQGSAPPAMPLRPRHPVLGQARRDGHRRRLQRGGHCRRTCTG